MTFSKRAFDIKKTFNITTLGIKALGFLAQHKMTFSIMMLDITTVA